MNLDHDFVQVWKFSEDQKKANGTLKFSQIQVKTKKKIFIKHKILFPPNSGEDPNEKRSSSKTEHFFPRIQVKTKKKGLQQE